MGNETKVFERLHMIPHDDHALVFKSVPLLQPVQPCALPLVSS
jgi:hypothetical protein